MLETVNVYTCDICGKKISFKENEVPSGILSSIIIEQEIAYEIHPVEFEHVCRDCLDKIKKTIQEIQEEPQSE